MILPLKGPRTYICGMTSARIGYARCSTDKQDLAAQRETVAALEHALSLQKKTRLIPGLNLGVNTEKVGVLAFNADLEKKVGRNEYRYGVEYTTNDVQSEAFREHIGTGEITYRTTRYPGGGSTMSSMAAYVSRTEEISDKFVISEGLRFTNVGEMRADIAGRPVYLGLAMDAAQGLRLKPQNLLLNLPLAGAS